MSQSRELSFKMISFTVESAASGKTSCSRCRSNIPKGHIRIKFIELYSIHYHHLYCFKPCLEQCIYKSDLKINLNESDLTIFTQWLEEWNSRFYTSSKKTETTENVKIIEKVQTIRRRALLEVFKFMNISDLLILSEVSKEFYQITEDEDLWKTLIYRDFKFSNSEENFRDFKFSNSEENFRDFKFSNSNENFKARYLEIFKKSCVECKQVPDKENYFKCLLINKIVCKECLKKEKFELMTKREIERTMFANVSELNLKYVVTRFGRIATYRFLVFSEVKKLRHQYKLKLLEFIQSETLLNYYQFVEDIDSQDMDLINRSIQGKVEVKPNYKNFKYRKLGKKIFNYIRLGKKFDFNKLRENGIK